MKKILGFSGIILILLLIIIVIKTITFKSLQIETEKVSIPVFGNESVPHLSEAVRFPTISYSVGSPIDTAAFKGFHNFLSGAYPLIHSKLKKETAITVLSKAVTNIGNNQMKAKITEPVNDFIRYIGPEMPFYARAIFANKWLFKGLILKIYQGSKTSNALVRTTTVPTIFNAGIKDNVIPAKAEAVVNFRILPGETSDDVMEHLKMVVSDDRVRILKLDGFSEPAPVSPVDVPGFKIIQKTIRQVYPEALVAPTMMLAASDSRKYIGVCRNIYNLPPLLSPQKTWQDHMVWMKEIKLKTSKGVWVFITC